MESDGRVYPGTQVRLVWRLLFVFLLLNARAVCRVDSMNVRDDTEIDWKLLPDEHWNLWSAHSLQRRWLTMKRGIKGFEDMSHAGPSMPCGSSEGR